MITDFNTVIHGRKELAPPVSSRERLESRWKICSVGKYFAKGECPTGSRSMSAPLGQAQRSRDELLRDRRACPGGAIAGELPCQRRKIFPPTFVTLTPAQPVFRRSLTFSAHRADVRLCQPRMLGK